MRKSEKSAYFCHAFANNFFMGNYFKTFSAYFFALISTFFLTSNANPQKTAQKNGKSLFMNVS